MPKKPNYAQDRAERTRARQRKQEEKLQRRDEKAVKRKTEGEAEQDSQSERLK